MSETVKRHYQSLYEVHGRGHSAVQYSSKESQESRFDVLLDIALQMNSIADIGCGLGDILPAVRRRFGNIEYYGYDFVEDFLADARQQFAYDESAYFQNLDITCDAIPVPADYVILSGTLNNAMEDNAGFTQTTLHRMWDGCLKGIAFNGLSTYVDYHDDGLYYQNPLELFDYCKRHFSPYVTLRHDYDIKQHSIPFEFTIYVLKK